jgi:negative regulator of sigma E activity
MTELLREQMSAFLDDALSSEETPLLLRRIHEDAELTRTYACYHLIGASLRNEPDGSALAERVRNALCEETLAPAGRPHAWRRLLKPVLGVAVAASVAVVAIGTLRVIEAGRVAPVATSVDAHQSAEPSSYIVAPPTDSTDTPSETAGHVRLVTYVMRHSNYANMPNSPVMNYRGLVGGQYPSATDTEDPDPADAKLQEPQAK